MGIPIARARRTDRLSDEDASPGAVTSTSIVEFGGRADASPGAVTGTSIVEFGGRADAFSLLKMLFDEHPTGLDIPEIIQSDTFPIGVIMRQGEVMRARRKICF